MNKHIFLFIIFLSVSIYIKIEVNSPEQGYPIISTIDQKELNGGSLLETTTNNLNFRTFGSLNAPVIKKFKIGMTLIYEGEVTKQKFHASINNIDYYEPFLKVREPFSNQEGWVYKAGVTFTKQPYDSLSYTTYSVISSSLNIRVGPSLDYPILKTLEHGTLLYHGGKVSDYKSKIKMNNKWIRSHWYYVKVPQLGISGWVYGGGISLTPTKSDLSSKKEFLDIFNFG